MVYIQRTNVTVLQKVSSVFQKGCKLSSTGCICSRSERVQTQASLQCVCVCMYFVCCKYMAHKHHVEHIFSCFYREIYSKSCYSRSKKCSRFVFSVLFESLHSKATSLISPIIPILSFPTQKRKKEEKICTLYVSLSHVLLTPYPLFALSAWVRWPCPTPQPVASGRVAFQSCGAPAFSSSWVI